MSLPETQPPAAYVHRVTKGYKRLFFSVSLPLGVIDVDDDTLTRQPEEVARHIAHILDLALTLHARPRP